MEIVEMRDGHVEAVKNLLVELQSHIASLDERGVVVLKDNFREDYFAFISKERNAKIFVAEECGSAVGMVICKIFQGGGEDEITTTCPKVGFISDLVTTRSKRGKGIGKALLAHAVQYFKACGCSWAQLEVFAPNTPAYGLYKGAGFAPLCIYMNKKI